MDSFYSVSERTLETEAILGMLRRTSGAYAEAELTISDVAVDTVRPLSAKLRSVRVVRAEELITVLRANGFAVFEPIVVQRDRGGDPWRLVLPPVLEHYGSGYVVVDGVHRFAAARRLGEETIRALTLSGVDAPLPCAPKEWADLEVVDERLPASRMLGDMNMSLLRPVASELGRLQFPTRAALDQFLRARAPRKGVVSWHTNG